MVDFGADIDDIAEDVENKFSVEFRNPYERPYGDPERQTDSQRILWGYLRDHNIWRQALIGAKGAGKASRLSDNVLTPRGFTEMRNIRPGDKVIGQDGTATEVLETHPQAKQMLYRVTFNDGTSVVVSPDHLWKVRTGSMKNRGSGWKVLRTKDLMRDVETSQGYSKWQIPTVQPIQFANAEDVETLPIPPYALGALIGDGGFTGNTPKFSTEDIEILRRVAGETGTGVTSLSGADYNLINSGNLKDQLAKLGLWGKKSYTKFVPETYKQASVEARRELLRGLLDTDGHIPNRSRGTFCSVSEQLVDDIVDIARSLGVVTEKRHKSTNSEFGEAWRCSINADFNPFWIDRKSNKYDTSAGQGDVKSIKSIEPEEEAYSKCITVASQDSLYVTEDYTVTHNTYYGATFAFYFGQKWPGAEGVVVGNTDRQAKDAAGGPFLEVCRALGYEAEYFSSKKIRGQEQSKFYVVDLDGEGYEQGNTFMLKVRSLEAVQAMEGSEFDFMWFEEIQQGDKEDFVTANSRNRGTHIAGEDTQNPLFIAGMTAGASHWMYSMLEDNMSFVVEERFDPEEHDSVLREPVLTENKKNIGQAKIDEYYNTFSSTEAERLIHAKRVSQNSDRAMYEYREDKHRNGRMSRLMLWSRR